MIYLKKSVIHGRGVFANKDIHKGEVIEKIPYIEFSRENSFKEIEKYTFGLKNKNVCLMMSYSSMLNHSNDPNSTIEECDNNEYLHLYSLKDIKKDEEITLSYFEGVKF